MIAKVNSLPRGHRFTLGDRIYTQSLDLVTALTEATFSPGAREKASERANSLRILLRLAKDLEVISFDAYT